MKILSLPLTGYAELHKTKGLILMVRL